MNEAMTALVRMAIRDRAAAQTMAMTREMTDLARAEVQDLATGLETGTDQQVRLGQRTANSPRMTLAAAHRAARMRRTGRG